MVTSRQKLAYAIAVWSEQLTQFSTEITRLQIYPRAGLDNYLSLMSEQTYLIMCLQTWDCLRPSLGGHPESITKVLKVILSQNPGLVMVANSFNGQQAVVHSLH